ncbi:UNVERIFIED_CONTAM: putative mitochondrial protein [Sesamum radiatum]|uniref:Mitochondrial protein n=1 Tax=Sesamum radiatum TaxID=300843 RepID=A0AAW2T5W7_SESRA
MPNSTYRMEGGQKHGVFPQQGQPSKKVNEIRKLRTDSDEWVDNEQDLRRLILDHFTKTFQSRRPSTVDIERCTLHITPRIDRNMYDELSRPFTEEEVSLALSQMAPLKAPGPDVSYSFMLNGGQFGSLIPQRGIRQGDPLSPYLFLLCTEALSSLLLAGERNGSMEGIAICRGAPKISHLLFADDTLVFSQATRQTMQCIGNTLDTYAKASGQEINYGKSTVVFSKNVPQDEQLELAAIIGLRPKIMLQSLASYRELWGDHRVLFSIIYVIESGDVSQDGMKNFYRKQFWCLLTNRNSLAHRIFQARYFPGATILDAKLGYRPSLVWRSIFSAKPLILTGLRYRVGSGFNIRIGLDPWIPRPSTFRPITVLPPHLAAASVSALIDHHTNDWCRECIETNFLPEDHDVILSIPLGCGIHEDIPIWHFTESGQFTVKSAYYLEISRSTDATSSVQAGSPSWNFFWSTKIPRRIQVFAWRACLNALPTSANLGHRIHSSLNACPYCET